MINTLEVCKKTRETAANTLTTVLRSLLVDKAPISEKKLRDRWLVELRKHSNLFNNGWYDPPPSGIGVLFGTTARKSRHNYKTLRLKKMWPRDDIFLDRDNGMAYLFASPVDRKSGIIGDFGLTVYFGEKSEIINHLKKCFEVNQKVFDFIEPGMKFSEAYDYASKVALKFRLVNNVTSKTDPTGTDFGHTIPASYFDWSNTEKSVLKAGEQNWEKLKKSISERRIFINPVEKTVFKPGMATTLEPRLTSVENPYLPMGSFHTIVLIHPDGKKELRTDFDGIFSLVGMDYMIEI